MVASTNNFEEWVLDSGPTHHMGASSEHFSFLKPSPVPYIYVENDTQVEVKGKGNVELDNGVFKDVPHVPNLSTNLLSIYQITQYGCGKKLEFLPDSVVMKNLKDYSMVAIGKVNHETRLYFFSHFLPMSTSLALLTHSNSQSKLWHERFGHFNYGYLQQFSNKDMVIGLPQVKYSEGVCIGFEASMLLNQQEMKHNHI